MADLTFTADLDLSAANSSVDELASSAGSTLEDALSSAVDAFSASFAAAASDAANTAADALAAIPDVSVGVAADTAPASGEVADLVASTDAQAATIAVDADTSAAQDAVSGLGDTLESMGNEAVAGTRGIIEAGSSTSALSGFAHLATGEVSGLGEVISETGGRVAGAVVGVTALSAGTYDLVQKGIEATAGQQLFNTVLGEQAAAIERVHLGDYAGDLFKLGIQFGSTDTAMQTSIATIYQHAQSAGFGAEQATSYAQQLEVLGARAVALNPSLGSSADVATRLEVAFARGGRALIPYNVTLSTNQILQEAYRETGKSVAADLTLQEKAQAGLNLAVAQYGDNLSTVLASGAKNAANEQKALRAEVDQMLGSLGKPLVAPFFEVLKAALPSVEAFGKVLAELATGALPAVAVALNGVSGPLNVLADALRIIQPIIGPLTYAFIAYETVTTILPALLGLAATGVLQLGIALPFVSDGMLTAAAGTEAFAGALASLSFGTVVAGLAAGAAGFELTTLALDKFVGHGPDLAKELDAVGEAASRAGNAATRDFVPAWEELRQKVGDLFADANKLPDDTTMFGKWDTNAKHVNSSLGDLVITMGAFRELAKANIGQAELLAAGTDKNSAAYRGMKQILSEVHLDKVTNDQAQAVSALTDTAQTLGVTVPNAASLSKKELEALDKALGEFTASFGTATTQWLLNLGVSGDALKQMNKNFTDFASTATGSLASITDAFETHDFSKPAKEQAAVSEQAMEDFFVQSQQRAIKWAGELQFLMDQGVNPAIVNGFAKAGIDSEPQLQAFDELVRKHGAQWVNDTYATSDAARAALISGYQQETSDLAIYVAERTMIWGAANALVVSGNEQALLTMTQSTDVNVARMAQDILDKWHAAHQGVAAEPIIGTLGVDDSQVTAAIAHVQQLIDLAGTTSYTPFEVLVTGGGHAAGGPVAAGIAYPVGEQGPELFVPQTAGTIIPNDKVYRPSSWNDSGGGASNRAAQSGTMFQIDRVVMEQATPNPVRETVRAAKQLRDAAAMARMS